MKQLRLSVKEHRLTDKYIPTFKTYDYTKSFDFENESDIEEIYETVNLHVHTYYDYNDNIRNEASFKSASAIFLDFDGKDGHNDSTLDEFLHSDFAKTYNWLFYTSKSHIPTKQECFHVIVPLNSPITDINTLRSTYASVFDEVHGQGLRCDTTVRDGARLIFPSLNESINDDDKHFDNFQFDVNHNGVYIDFVEPTEEVPVVKKYKKSDTRHTIEVDDDDDVSDYVQEFHKMSMKAKYAYVNNIVKYINVRNRKSGYTFLKYNAWIGIGYTLYKLFGEVNGRKLFRTLSKGHPKDTRDTIDDQFSYLNDCTTPINKSLESLIHLSGSIGYRHTMYFRYYFITKHRFNPSQTATLYQRMVRVLMNDYGFDGPITNVKLYDYSFKKNTRTFLMEVSYGDDVYHVSVRLSEMIDIMSDLLKIPRKFVTTSITKGVIRRFININGVYDITRYIEQKVLTILKSHDDDYIRVSEIHNVMQNIRTYAPSTIQNLVTNKNIELYFFELGIFTDKRKKRFTLNGSSKPYMGYKVDKSKIVLSDRVSIPKSVYYLRQEPKKKEVMATPVKRSVVMQC